jgi:hypothetical protein
MKIISNLKLRMILVFTILCTSSPDIFSQEHIMIAWMAANVGDKAIINFDVEKYVDRVMLSDFSKSKLFIEANKDYNKYKILKRDYIYRDNASIFKSALKKMVYGEMVKQHALYQFKLNSSDNNSRRGLFGGRSRNSTPEIRNAFNITESQYFDMVNKTETRMLKKYLDKKMGIVKARDAFGNNLKKGNFPHKLTDSNTDIYYRWYKAMKNKLKQDMFENEVKKWEAIQATKNNIDLHIRPMEVHDFYKSTAMFITDNVINQDMTLDQWTNMISSHPELTIMMEKTKILSLGGASLASIYKQDKVKFQSLKKEIINKFSTQLNDQLIEKILSYENKALSLANKYSSAQKLWELYKKYDLKADDRSLMLSKLYRLAATIKEGNVNREETRTIVKTELKKAIKLLKEKLNTDSFYLAEINEKKLFHMLVSSSLNDDVRAVLENADDYTKRTLYMGIWFTKFLASKIALGTNVTIKTDICAYNTYQCQKKITDWLKMVEYNNGLEKFRNKTLQDHWKGMFNLNPVGKASLNGQEAIDFIFN